MIQTTAATETSSAVENLYGKQSQNNSGVSGFMEMFANVLAKSEDNNGAIGCTQSSNSSFQVNVSFSHTITKSLSYFQQVTGESAKRFMNSCKDYFEENGIDPQTPITIGKLNGDALAVVEQHEYKFEIDAFLSQNEELQQYFETMKNSTSMLAEIEQAMTMYGSMSTSSVDYQSEYMSFSQQTFECNFSLQIDANTFRINTGDCLSDYDFVWPMQQDENGDISGTLPDPDDMNELLNDPNYIPEILPNRFTQPDYLAKAKKELNDYNSLLSSRLEESGLDIPEDMAIFADYDTGRLYVPEDTENKEQIEALLNSDDELFNLYADMDRDIALEKATRKLNLRIDEALNNYYQGRYDQINTPESYESYYPEFDEDFSLVFNGQTAYPEFTYLGDAAAQNWFVA